MPARLRLSRADFSRMRGFRRLQGGLFSLSYGVISERIGAGVAVVVSKKVAADAVDRNRIKRRSRAILGRIVPSLSPARVFVAVAKKGAATASFDDFALDLENLLQRATLENE